MLADLMLTAGLFVDPESHFVAFKNSPEEQPAPPPPKMITTKITAFPFSDFSTAVF